MQLYVHIYIYIYIMYVCICIYIYIEREREICIGHLARPPDGAGAGRSESPLGGRSLGRRDRSSPPPSRAFARKQLWE